MRVANVILIQVNESLADPVIAEKKVPNKPEKKARKAIDESWDPNELYKDAAWFASNGALPIEGDNPYKISYITEKQLAACFGGKERNGYKLSNCAGIPVADVPALSEVVDGYDKPVNRVLSYTFAKGAYAKRVLKRKVDWASYAATKLKCRIVQWERVGKGKPDCPPCIKQPRVYSCPSAATKLKCRIVQWERVGKGKPDCPPCVKQPQVYSCPSAEESKPHHMELEFREAKKLLGIETSIVPFNEDVASIPNDSAAEAVQILEPLPMSCQQYTSSGERASTGYANLGAAANVVSTVHLIRGTRLNWICSPTFVVGNLEMSKMEICEKRSALNSITLYPIIAPCPSRLEILSSRQPD